MTGQAGMGDPRPLRTMASETLGHQPTVVLVRIQARTGHEDNVKQEAAALFARIRREEPGCEYIVGHQDSTDPTRFMYFEEWRDRVEFDEFRSTRGYLQDYFERLKPHVEDGGYSLWVPFA